MYLLMFAQAQNLFLRLYQNTKTFTEDFLHGWMSALAEHHLVATVTSSRDFTPLTGMHNQATSFLLIQCRNPFVQLKVLTLCATSQNPNASPGVTAVGGSTAIQTLSANRGISALPAWPQPRSSQSTAANLCHLLRTDTGTPQKMQEFPLVPAERGGKA